MRAARDARAGSPATAACPPGRAAQTPGRTARAGARWPGRAAPASRPSSVDGAEEGEDERAHDRVMDVREHVEAAVARRVTGRIGQRDPGDPADQEVEDPGEAEQHRDREPDPAAP